MELEELDKALPPASSRLKTILGGAPGSKLEDPRPEKLVGSSPPAGPTPLTFSGVGNHVVSDEDRI